MLDYTPSLVATRGVCAASTCDRVVVSGVGILNGTYTYIGYKTDMEDSSVIRPFLEMIAGVDVYKLFWYDSNGFRKWALTDPSSFAYMVSHMT